MPENHTITSVSVIIPTFNRVHTLKEVLDHLERQTWHGGPVEVVLVDDHSSDGTFEMLQAYSSHNPDSVLEICAYQNPSGSTSSNGYISCLNYGLRKAKHQLCIFLDDDLVPAVDLIEQHVKTHEEWGRKGESVVCRGWRTEDYFYDQLGQYSIQEDRLYQPKLRYYLENLDSIDPGLCFGNNFSVLRKYALEAGGFGEDEKRYGQDTRLARRCHVKLGMRCVANVHALGSHIPLPEDVAGEKGQGKQQPPTRTPQDKVNCVVGVGAIYMVTGQLQRIPPLLDEAERIIREELEGNPGLLEYIDNLRSELKSS